MDNTIEREPCPECHGFQVICSECGGSGLSGCSLDRIMSCFGYTSAAIQGPIDAHEHEGFLWRTVWLNDGRVIQVGPRSAMIFTGPEQLSRAVPFGELDDRRADEPTPDPQFGEDADSLIRELRRQDELALALGRAVVDNFAEELEGDLDLNGGDVVQVISEVFQYETQLGNDEVGRRVLRERDRRAGVVATYCPQCGEGNSLGDHWDGVDAARELRLQPFQGHCPKCGTTRVELALDAARDEREIMIEGSLDAACLSIQDAIGQTDGGLASMFFSGPNGDRFRELMDRYLDDELRFWEDILPAAQEPATPRIICPAADCEFCKPGGVPVPGVPLAAAAAIEWQRDGSCPDCDGTGDKWEHGERIHGTPCPTCNGIGGRSHFAAADLRS